MIINNKLTGERLRSEITNPNFLRDLSNLVEKSREHNLVGRCNLLYSPDKGFYASDKVGFYEEADLVQDDLELDESDKYHLQGERFTAPFSNPTYCSDNDDGHLVAQVYTIPQDYDEPTIRAFNLHDLAVARMGRNIESGLAGEEEVFRPFGIVAESYDLDTDGMMLGLHFYREKTNEPHMLGMLRRERAPDFEKVAAQNTTSSENLVATIGAAMSQRERISTHAFPTAWYSQKTKKFDDGDDPKFFEKLVQWDKAGSAIPNQQDS